MARRRKTSKTGWDWKRIAYIGLLLTSGSGGAGGYLLKDHPMLANLLHTVLGTVAGDGDPDDANLAGKLKQVLDVTRGFQTAGSFAVTIDAIELGSLDLPKPPRVEVSVRSINEAGEAVEVWAGDETPAVRDEVDGNWIAQWDDEPFQIDWAPGQKIAVSVTAWTGRRTSTKLYMVAASTPGFPLRPGAYGLRDGEKPTAPADPSTPGRRIVFKATRIPDGPAPAPARIAGAPAKNDGIVVR